MRPKNTFKMLGPIETNIVARLTYEKKSIVTAKDMDQLFNLSPEMSCLSRHFSFRRKTII
jgi:hypothetical protein